MKKTAFTIIFSFTISTLSAQKSDSLSTTKQLILFVCEHGAGRSAIAAAYFNKLVKANGLNYQAEFRGIDPQETLGESTRKGLMTDSIDVTNMKPQKVSKEIIRRAVAIITLDCTLPDSLHTQAITWKGIEMNGNYHISKSQIAVKIEEFIKSLKKNKPK